MKPPIPVVVKKFVKHTGKRDVATSLPHAVILGIEGFSHELPRTLSRYGILPTTEDSA